jgi:signal transduction histidine kinase
MDSYSEEQRRHIRVDPGMDIGTVNIPFRSLCRTVKGLLLNGLEASSDNADVDMHWFTSSDKLCIKVSDSGTGIKEGDKELVTAPFFTTKETGLGLGLFLAKNLADQFRGTLDISSETGKGTTVMMSLSLDLLAYEP